MRLGQILLSQFAQALLAVDAHEHSAHQRNQRLIEALQELAAAKGITASQLAIAWVLAKGPEIVPLIGAREATFAGGMIISVMTLLTVWRVPEIVKFRWDQNGSSARCGKVVDEERIAD